MPYVRPHALHPNPPSLSSRRLTPRAHSLGDPEPLPLVPPLLPAPFLLHLATRLHRSLPPLPAPPTPPLLHRNSLLLRPLHLARPLLPLRLPLRQRKRAPEHGLRVRHGRGPQHHQLAAEQSGADGDGGDAESAGDRWGIEESECGEGRQFGIWGGEERPEERGKGPGSGGGRRGEGMGRGDRGVNGVLEGRQDREILVLRARRISDSDRPGGAEKPIQCECYRSYTMKHRPVVSDPLKQKEHYLNKYM